MSRSQRWKLEWASFLGENGRRQYNRICRDCVRDCKQSFRVILVECPRYCPQGMKKGLIRVGNGENDCL